MRVLQVSESDRIGGAALAALRLTNALNQRDVNSSLLVNRKISNDNTIIAPVGFLAKFLARIKPHLYIWRSQNKFDSNCLSVASNASSSIFLNNIYPFKYNILHLHWVNNGFVKLHDLMNFKKPIIWTLHDTWLFTGGCHSTQGCMQFLVDCSSCPKSNSNIGRINLYQQFLAKKQILSLLTDKITFTVPSTWMLESAQESALLKNFRIVKIPNMINTEVFRPLNKQEVMFELGLNTSYKYFVFGATNPLGDLNKGFAYLQTVFEKNEYPGYKLIIFGKSKFDPKTININIEVVFWNEIDSDEKLCKIYNVAEVLLMPSVHESFGQVAAEAMSCGIPVVCFDTTGLKDIVEHKKNGYLAALGNEDDFNEGIKWVLNNKNDNLGFQCRDKIESEFSPNVVCKMYVGLYNRQNQYA
jgi:glycosyltransferase involved in cell wall biosynthesis